MVLNIMCNNVKKFVAASAIGSLLVGSVWFAPRSTSEELDSNMRPYQRAAVRGDIEGIAELARYYYNRGWKLGKAADFKSAILWAQVGIEKGDAQCLRLLGRCYYYGQGTDRNIDQAIDLFTQSSNLGDGEAKMYLGCCYAYFKKFFLHEQKAEAFFQEAIQAGETRAHYHLGRVYLQLHRLENSFAQFKIGAEAGDSNAIAEYVHSLRLGRGCKPDSEAALATLRSGAEAGHANLERMLGGWTFHGTCVTADKSAGIAWLQKAAEHGDETAASLVEYFRIEGEGIEKDVSRGIAFLKKKAEAGNDDATRLLAECYALGRGGQVDLNQAISVLRKSYDKGNYANSLFLANLQLKAGQTEDLLDTLLTLCNAGNAEAFNMLVDHLEENRFPSWLLDEKKRAGDYKIESAMVDVRRRKNDRESAELSRQNVEREIASRRDDRRRRELLYRERRYDGSYRSVP